MITPLPLRAAVLQVLQPDDLEAGVDLGNAAGPHPQGLGPITAVRPEDARECASQVGVGSLDALHVTAGHPFAIAPEQVPDQPGQLPQAAGGTRPARAPPSRLQDAPTR